MNRKELVARTLVDPVQHRLTLYVLLLSAYAFGIATGVALTYLMGGVKAISMAKSFIVKLQWPITAVNTEEEVLIYNVNKSIFQTFPCSKELRKAMGGELKRFFSAKINEDTGELVIGDPVPDQEW